jgi:ribose transport system substrate-binding protein
MQVKRVSRSVYVGVICLALVLLVGLTGWARGKKEIDVKNITIGFTNWTLGDAFCVDLQNGILKAAEKAGVKVVAYNNEGGKEVDNTRTMLSQKVDGAIMCYWDPNLAKTSISLLREKNIPILAVDIPMPGTCFLGVENYSVGQQGGEYIAKYIKDKWGGKLDLLVVINSPTEGELVAKRFQGQEDAILKEISQPKDKIEYADGGGWADGTLKVTRPILAKHPKAKNIAFVIENDPCSIAAVTALEEAGKAKNAIIVTQGVQSDTRPLIKAGNTPVKAGVAYFPENYADQGIGKLIEIIKLVKAGKPLDEAYKAVIKDATIDFAVEKEKYIAPAIYVKTELITPENIDSFYPNVGKK